MLQAGLSDLEPQVSREEVRGLSAAPVFFRLPRDRRDLRGVDAQGHEALRLVGSYLWWQQLHQHQQQQR